MRGVAASVIRWAGHGTSIVTIVLTGGQTDQLHASLALRGGEIDAGGVRLTNGNRFTLLITGGTGAARETPEGRRLLPSANRKSPPKEKAPFPGLF